MQARVKRPCGISGLTFFFGLAVGTQLAAIILVVNAGGDLLNAVIVRDP